jgi:hypothetical protein
MKNKKIKINERTRKLVELRREARRVDQEARRFKKEAGNNSGCLTVIIWILLYILFLEIIKLFH